MIALRILPIAVFICSLSFSAVVAEDDELFFETDIRPILKTHCFHCHGERGEKEGGLDLRLRRFIVEGGESGPAIEPSDPASSFLWERLELGEMPPADDKQISAHEFELIERWIAQGAKTKRDEPESIDDGFMITHEDREFWSFRPIGDFAPPIVNATQRVRTPIDQFVLSQLEKEGLGFADDAKRRTLIRRVSFDLTGLPPSEAQIDEYLNDTSEHAYEAMVDRILDSPHYGERWGRHWLDVAGYADSEGYDRDAARSWAYHYRDYVIRSFNEDKPYDQFILEQLAGDELLPRPIGEITPEKQELLAATGFLRMAADGTGSGNNDEATRNQVVADTVEILGTALTGLSVHCARCHDHRYDPIAQTDYYRLRAILEPALDWQQWKVPSQRQFSLYTEEDREKARQVAERMSEITSEKQARQDVLMAEALEQELNKYDEELRGTLKAAYESKANERTPEQVQLLKQYPSVNITPGVLYQYNQAGADELKAFDARRAEVAKEKPLERFLRVLIEDPNRAPPTHVFHRGDHRQPLEIVAPGPLSIAIPPMESRETVDATFANSDALTTSGRRMAYAKWLAESDNPLFARVMVNRIWLHHFGRGIVNTPGDFGRLGESPTHPELLDWLATQFRNEGWSIKAMHRLILKSTVYRQASRGADHGLEIDPLNRLYWRWPIQRLDAESVRDALLSVSGRLNETMFGPPVGLTQDDAGQVLVEANSNRRSVYVQVKRTQPVAVLQLFDQPSMLTNCVRRNVSTAAPQSLLMLNSQLILDQAEGLANRIGQPNLSSVEEELAASFTEPSWSAPNVWSLGYGRLSDDGKRVEAFALYPFSTESAHQGGPERPDPEIGWSLLTARGGHPGNSPDYCAIRRWIAPQSGTLSIRGLLKHASEKGDGVQGTLVSSIHGTLGQWQVHHGQAETNVDSIQVAQGEVIDFVTDGRSEVSFDSFDWTAVINLQPESGGEHSVWNTTESLEQETSTSVIVQIDRVWRYAFQRQPTDDEVQLALGFLQQQCESQAERDGRHRASHLRQSLVNLCQAVLTSNEFLYVE